MTAVPTLLQRVRRALLLILLATALLLIGYTWMALHFAYSSGERAGVLQKLSRKGWLCKTWEGEMLLTPVAGSIPEKFTFTVGDDTVAARLNALMGQRVTLNYEQHRGIPTSCFGDTEYFIQGVHEVAP
jgi:hypothetical protein